MADQVIRPMPETPAEWDRLAGEALGRCLDKAGLSAISIARWGKGYMATAGGDGFHGLTRAETLEKLAAHLEDAAETVAA